MKKPVRVIEAIVRRNTRKHLVLEINGTLHLGSFNGQAPAWGLRCDLGRGDRIAFLGIVSPRTVSLDPYSVRVNGRRYEFTVTANAGGAMRGSCSADRGNTFSVRNFDGTPIDAGIMFKTIVEAIVVADHGDQIHIAAGSIVKTGNGWQSQGYQSGAIAPQQ